LECKISDFGSSRRFVWTNSISGKVSDNPLWIAPEILRNEKYNEKVDVYSFGLICWQFLTAKPPFDDEQYKFTSITIEKILHGQRPEIPEETESYFRDLIQQCWAQEPKNRLSFIECFECISKRTFNEEWRNKSIETKTPRVLKSSKEQNSINNTLSHASSPDRLSSHPKSHSLLKREESTPERIFSSFTHLAPYAGKREDLNLSPFPKKTLLSSDTVREEDSPPDHSPIMPYAGKRDESFTDRPSFIPKRTLHSSETVREESLTNRSSFVPNRATISSDTVKREDSAPDLLPRSNTLLSPRGGIRETVWVTPTKPKSTTPTLARTRTVNNDRKTHT